MVSRLKGCKYFMHSQVVREVAVLDNINPGGMYATRVRMLGRYAQAQPAIAKRGTLLKRIVHNLKA